MKKETLLLIAVASVAGYFIWKNSKKNTVAPVMDEKSVPVEVMEPVKIEPEPEPQSEKLSANAAVTHPSYAKKIFQRPWVLMQSDVKTGYQTNSPFN